MKKNNILFLSLAFALFFSCKAPQQTAKSNEPASGGDRTRSADSKLSQTQQADVMYIYYNATKEKMLGNQESAENLFSQVLRQDINNHAAMFNLADIYTEQKRYSDALYFAKKAYALDSRNEWYARLLVEIYDRTKKYSEAATVYQKLIKDYPERVEFYFGLAEELIYQDKLQEAIKVYDQIESKVGLSSEVSLQKERLYIKLGKNDKAIGEVQKLIDSEPGNTRYLSALGSLYQIIGQDEKALEVYNKILIINPDDPYVHLSLADYYRTKGEKEKSYSELKKAFVNKELDTETKISILSSYYPLMDVNEEMKSQAMELGQLLIESSPSESRVHAVYGDFLTKNKKYEEARKEYREAARLGAKEFVVYQQILFMDSQLNDTTASITDSEEAISKFPEQPLPYYFKGATKLQQKKYAEAVDVLNAGLKLVVDNKDLEARFYSALGDAYNYLKDHKQSDANYEKALNLNPKEEYVLNNWAYYLSMRGEQLEKAEQMSKLSMELQPNSATFEDTYAWILYKLGRFRDAKEWMEKAFSHGADKSGTSLEHYGDIMFKLGDPEKALEYWQKAKRSGDEVSELLDKKIADKKLYEANGNK